MAGETNPIVPEGNVKVAGRDVEYSIITAFGLGILLGMILKA